MFELIVSKLVAVLKYVYHLFIDEPEDTGDSDE